MRCRTVVAIICAASLLIPTALAQQLTDNDRRFVVITAGAPVVALRCGAIASMSAFPSVGDRFGVFDSVRIFKATAAAIALIGHQAYEKQDLIPEVTRLVEKFLIVIDYELASGDHATCERYLKIFRAAGAVQ